MGIGYISNSNVNYTALYVRLCDITLHSTTLYNTLHCKSLYAVHHCNKPVVSRVHNPMEGVVNRSRPRPDTLNKEKHVIGSNIALLGVSGN